MSKVKLGDVAREYKETCSDKQGLPIVGLEHLISGEIRLTQWDEDIDNTFTKTFRKGQVLFGRRRAYLKKAVVAPFDGVCSGDITVIEAIPGKIIPELLPFIIQNDELFDFAVGRSAGSLSPRVKWEHLQNYEFDLPEIEQQSALAAALWAAEDTKDAYKRVIFSSDELVKSQFVEMFGDCKCKRLGDYIRQVRGVSYKPADLSVSLDNDHITLLRANNISNGELKFDDVQFVDKSKVSKSQLLQTGDIVMCASSGSIEHVGKSALYGGDGDYTFGAFCKVVRASGLLSPRYIYSFFMTDEYKSTISLLACGTNINNLRNEHIDELMIPVPTEAQQQEFSLFAEQLDKSKFAAKQALKDLEETQKALMLRHLG